MQQSVFQNDAYQSSEFSLHNYKVRENFAKKNHQIVGRFKLLKKKLAKLTISGFFNQPLSNQNVNAARFVRNVKFWAIFKHYVLEQTFTYFSFQCRICQ